MTCELRIPTGRGLLRPVLTAVPPVRLPLWDRASGEWVLTYGAAAEAARARIVSDDAGACMDKKPEIKLIDWRTVGGIKWLAHVPNGDTRWRRWRQWGRGIVTCEPGGWLALADLETPIYPWTVITGAQLMGAL